MSDWRISGLYASGPDDVHVDVDTLADRAEMLVEHEWNGTTASATIPLYVVMALLRNKGLIGEKVK